MPKEDRSSWVAVAPDASSAGTTANKIKPAMSAYMFFQQQVSDQVKAEYMATHTKFQVGEFSKSIRDKWNQLSPDEREEFENLARKDRMRFASESHAADVAAMERREKLQRERETLLMDDEGGKQRQTRRQHAKKERKKERKEKKHNVQRSLQHADDQEFVDDDEDSSSDSYEGESDSDDSAAAKKRKPATTRQPTAKQVELREKRQKEKMEKEAIIAERQQDVRKEKANQAKRRLEFLLKQSNIFSHFGQVKQDQAKYGITTNNKSKGDASLNRRDSVQGEEDEQDLEDADTHQATFLSAQPTTLGFGTMRPYQLEGLNWMIRLQENGVNGILADEMGLGKTLQSISILVYMLEYQHNTGPHLVVVPKSTLSNWMNEIARWGPTLTPVKFHGDKNSREEIANNILCPGQRDADRKWNVCITTYEVCNIEKNVLNKFAWSYLIIDEAHRLKNEASTFSLTVRSFETRYRILLTGTPLQNSLHELWALLNFLVPDVFASSEQFDEWFNLDIEDNDEKNRLISQLHKILRPFMLRRLKKEVETSLPPKHETILFTGMSAMQKKLYRDILIRDIDSLQGNSGSRTAILNIVMQLRKCAGHPYLFPGVEDRTLPPLGDHLVENCGKMVLLDKLLKRLKERGHRVLLFTQMTRILDIMEDYLVMRRFPYCRIDGNTTYEVREDYIDAFNAPNSEKFIFLLSTRAGGLGINLQTADVVILYDSDWNPQADLQAQDRAHRIGQKREVQVFRLVTEHTVEEKIVERAQQKLKLDAMVVQQGRLKEKDKLSRDELLSAVRFGADKIFKSKDSSITDEDIDMILDAGKRKTQELNEKLKAADKGDLLDFKLDGSSNLQTFEGVDYSSGGALAAAKAEADLLNIIDMGKRERRPVANYNENKLYQEQMAAMGGATKERKKKKIIRLPKSLRLPRMEEWQMFDMDRLTAIQEEEESKFRALPEEVQKLATETKKETTEPETEKSDPAVKDEVMTENGDSKEEEKKPEGPVELPPLLDEATQAEKESLLKEGFITWSRPNYSTFVKASARHGRDEISKIALEVGKSEEEVQLYANAFWGKQGQTRFSEHEYDRVVKLIEKGERKIRDIKSLETATRRLVMLFDNPWEELEFSHVNTKDKLFSPANDRYLLCWTHKYGYGEWGAVKMAIRRSPKFRFDYFLRSLPVDVLGRRCEHLMRAAVKEVEDLEKKAREMAGLPTEAEEGKTLEPVELPSYKEMKRRELDTKRVERDAKRKQLEASVEGLESKMKEIQDRLKELSRDPSEFRKENVVQNGSSAPKKRSRPPEVENDDVPTAETTGALGPDGSMVDFPDYDGSEPPRQAKKAFTHFCSSTRREVKALLSPEERSDKEHVNEILRGKWLELDEEEKQTWRNWAEWDKKRYTRDVAIYEKAQESNGGSSNSPNNSDEAGEEERANAHIPKKRVSAERSLAHIPKKRKKTT
eukprot:Nitzschia sp. Nitz4//scaffold162_size51285//15820//20464//NITZ4_006968-RA/size51285-processed-gene-0.20-mRNA-1//1//CDS//3329537970//4528//frame0